MCILNYLDDWLINAQSHEVLESHVNNVYEDVREHAEEQALALSVHYIPRNDLGLVFNDCAAVGGTGSDHFQCSDWKDLKGLALPCRNPEDIGTDGGCSLGLPLKIAVGHCSSG